MNISGTQETELITIALPRVSSPLVLRGHRQNTCEGNWNLYPIRLASHETREGTAYGKNAKSLAFSFTEKNNLFFRDYFFWYAGEDASCNFFKFLIKTSINT